MKNLVVFTGAGMSAESGIPTFRGTDGLWEGHRIEDVATPEAWARNPDLVSEFYNVRRRNVMQAQPNAGHLQIAAWEKQYHVQVVTQNIDDLHERAGSTQILHLHGEIMKVRSSVDASDIRTLKHWEVTANDLCKKGQRLRPHIVWFGEAVPLMDEAIAWVAQADVLVVVGTSLQVYPAAGLVHYTRPHTAIYVVDPYLDALPGGVHATLIRKGASEGLALLNL
jgi:NAD-dependent deacetylase